MPAPEPRAGNILDIHEGTYFQAGITSVFKTQAVRRGIVHKDNLINPDRIHDNRDAIIDILNDVSVVSIGHPSDHTLPLSHIRAHKWGEHAYVELFYQHTRGSFPPYVPATGASFDSVYEHEPVFRRTTEVGPPPAILQFADGLPGGDIDFRNDVLGASDEGNEPRRRIYKKPALRIVVNTVLTNSPYASGTPGVQGLVGHVNDGEIIFLGLADLPGTYAANQIRYDGAKVKWLGPFQFQVQYFFTYSFRWIEQRATFTGSTWQVFNEDKYPAAPFGGAFPIGIFG